jgi:cyclopropane fatty-acyl-phospholipid synthase-like methyltransferase
MYLDLYNNTYDRFCDYIETKNSEILEIGCGPGNITKHLISKRPDFKILGLDIAPNMIKLAIKNNPLAKFEVKDIRTIDNIERNFDAIISGFTLPYLSCKERIKFIQDCENILSKNGILYFSFVEGDYAKSDFQTRTDGSKILFYYHELEKIRDELDQYQFQIIDLEKIKYEEQLHTIIIVKKR